MPAPLVIASSTLANGLRTEFADTYTQLRIKQADSRLGWLMDLNVGATNRQHEFAYFNAAPHMEYWARGGPVPQDAMDSVQFTAYVYEWARRIEWSKFDRADDRTQSLMDVARDCGRSAALLPERFFFDLLTGSTNTLPAVPLAPDGAAFFAPTAGGAARFGATNGNLLTGNGVASVAAIQTDFYSALEQFLLFQDGKGQPLLSAELIDAGLVVVYGAANTMIFEEAFSQRRQGNFFDSTGSNVVTTGVVAGNTPSNVILDASRNVQLWGTQRITDNDWFVFLKEAPKKATFLMDREGIKEYASLEGDNNSDHTRNTGNEYIQWETRQGAAIALPYAGIKINN